MAPAPCRKPGSCAGSRLAFRIGWFFGFGYFVEACGGRHALLVEADAFAWALPLAVFGLPAFLARHGLATALARLLWSTA